MTHFGHFLLKNLLIVSIKQECNDNIMFNFLRILAIVTIIISLPQSSFADNHRTMEVKVYFSDFSKTADCNIVKEIVRRVPKTKSIATAALQELFKGPTETEKKEFEVGSEFSHLSKSILKT